MMGVPGRHFAEHCGLESRGCAVFRVMNWNLVVLDETLRAPSLALILNLRASEVSGFESALRTKKVRAERFELPTF